MSFLHFAGFGLHRQQNGNRCLLQEACLIHFQLAGNGSVSDQIETNAVYDFLCTGEHPTESDPDVLILEVFAGGWRKLTTKISTVSALGLGSVAATPRRHG